MIFSLNSIIGFACAAGIDMGFNTKHHEAEKATSAFVHIHVDGKKHVHQEKKHSHNNSKAYRHNYAGVSDNATGDDDCCSGKVTSFQQLDKSIAVALDIVHPVFYTATVSTYFHLSVLPPAGNIKDIKLFVRSYHPPIADIRIAIQSFQV